MWSMIRCARWAKNRGTSLPEILVVLLILGVSLGVAWPGASQGWDRLQVVQAREEVLALRSRARAEAVSRGGAEVRFRVGERAEV